MFSLGSFGLLEYMQFSHTFHYSYAKGYAIPAINCVSSSGINACLEAARKNDAPVIIQFSSGGSQVSCQTEFVLVSSTLSNETHNALPLVLWRKGIE